LYRCAVVAVSTPAAADRADPANIAFRDLRRDAAVPSGTHEWTGPDVNTGWHRHPYHQLEYAFAGVAEVETAAGRYLLPPQQAIWIPAGLAHVTTLRRVHSISLFLDPRLVAAPDDRARVLPAAPVVREMLAYGRRWPIGRRGSDVTADRYFEVLAALVLDWLALESPLHLPSSTDPIVRAAIANTDANLASVSLAAVCGAVGVSERTLRRRFAEELGMSWQAYVVQSRLQRAAAMLAEREITVLEAAVAVGFDSGSSFARAFRARLGETPTAYQRRVRRRPADGQMPADASRTATSPVATAGASDVARGPRTTR
jgi:AraC-like DNA-binding protein